MMGRFGQGRIGLGLVGAVVVLAVTGAPAAADHQVGHSEPLGPAAVRFADDVPELLDSEWGFPIGGFGGIAAGAPRGHVPVILVHGNNVDHADWYPVRDDFRAAGWTDQELWALSYNGLGNAAGSSSSRSNPERDEEHDAMGSDGVSRVTANDVNVPDLAAFIRMVQDYTGSRHVSLVGHSLGVTLIRQTLAVHTDLQDDVVAVVSIAGANHGTSLCPPGSEGVVHSCDEIAAGTPWLAELNGPDGARETYGAIQWLTISDGSGAGDVAFVGPTYADSPLLLGADNRTYPGMDHNGLRLVTEIVAEYRVFLEEAEATVAVPVEVEPPGDPDPDWEPDTDTRPADGSDDGASAEADGSPAGTSLPATGGGFAGVGALLAVAALRGRGGRSG